MRKFLFSILSCFLACNFFKPSVNASEGLLILNSSDEPSIYSGHHSHCSHASHHSCYHSNERERIYITANDSIDTVSIEERFCYNDSLRSIVKSYIANLELSDSIQTHFKGKALVVVVKDDYGNFSRGPRIKVTTHIIPFNQDINIYFSSNGHIGYCDTQSLISNLDVDLHNQFRADWNRNIKKPWMYKFNKEFYEKIINLDY